MSPLTVEYFCDAIDVSDSLEGTLRAIDYHNIETVYVFVNGAWVGPGSLALIVGSDIIERLRVVGSHCRKSWSWNREIECNGEASMAMAMLELARADFNTDVHAFDRGEL